MSTVVQGRVLRPAQAAEKLAIGLSTYWDKVKNESGFPRPFRIGPRTTVTYEDEIDSYVAACAAKSRAA